MVCLYVMIAMIHNNYDDTDGVLISNEPLAGAGSMLSLESVVSVDSAVSDADLDCPERVNADRIHLTNSGRRLTKSVSVDSGKGLSIDDLVSIEDQKLQERINRRIASVKGIKSAQAIPQGLVKMMSDRLFPLRRCQRGIHLQHLK